tara:strand:+ start:1114 stop:2133 length:1020 start_codon:yes stop_codon:yes gene_type:complete
MVLIIKSSPKGFATMYERLKIDTLRGLACVLLIAYHVIGFNAETGLKLSEGALRDINDTLVFIRMPLFTFLSGLVYAFRPFSFGGQSFIYKKVRRLLFPMLSVGTIFALLQAFTPGANSNEIDWLTLHIKPVAHFWFIESLFIVFTFVLICEKLKFFDGFNKFIYVFIFSIVLYISPINSDYFSFSGFIYLLPYFLFGMSLVRFNFSVNISPVLGLALLFFLIFIITLIFKGIVPYFEQRSLSSLILGCLGCLILLVVGIRFKPLAWIGSYSYSIYLFHVFFTAGTRIILHKLNVYDVEIIFSIALATGLLLPILTEKILEKNYFTNLVFLGKGIKRDL